MFKYIWYPKTFNNFRKSGVTGYVLTHPKSHFFLSWMLSMYKISKRSLPANIYLFKVNRTNIRKRYEICLKPTMKKPERPQWRRSGIFWCELWIYFIRLTSVLTLSKEMFGEQLFLETLLVSRSCNLIDWE